MIHSKNFSIGIRDIFDKAPFKELKNPLHQLEYETGRLFCVWCNTKKINAEQLSFYELASLYEKYKRDVL